MSRIQTRLTLLFVAIVTLVLAVSGGYTRQTMGSELEHSDQRMRQGVLMRLQISLPSALWDLDKDKVDSIVDAEMLPPEVMAIRVYDSAVGLFAGKMRDARGRLVAAGARSVPAGTPVEAALWFRERASGGAVQPEPVGKVVINFSRAPIDAVLGRALMHKTVEVLLLDIILVLALSLSLRVIFSPLRQLRDALFALAERASGEVEELPERRRDELGEVIRGFNLIQRRMRSTMARIRAAEEEAQRSAQQAAHALHDLRQTQESLLQAERLASLGALTAGIAHEINTPVGIALTSASVLKEATEEMHAALERGNLKRSAFVRYLETADEAARLIMNNAWRAAHLIHSFKQIAADQTSEARRQFVLRDYLEEIVASLQPVLKKAAIAVRIDCPREIVLDSYPGAFAQVITNLVINCSEHAFDPGADAWIQIGARACGETVELRVADNGKGVAPELIGHIFDPFFTTRRGQGGTGLGLAIVSNLLTRRLDGGIAVSSEPGQGTVFTLSIARVAAPEQPAPGAAAAAREHI